MRNTVRSLNAAYQAAQLTGWMRQAARRLRAYLMNYSEACGEARAAEILYYELSNLSDYELKQRGLSRASLAHAIREATLSSATLRESPEPEAGRPHSANVHLLTSATGTHTVGS